MKRIVLIVVGVLVVVFIIAQFFRPAQNNSEINAEHILKNENIPPKVQTVLENSCLDCHSNTTQYLWFHHIVPVAWMINGHIEDGKEELNLSDWRSLDAFSKMDALDEMCEEVEKKNMPLKSYAAIHPKARLNDEERKLLCDWMEKRIEELMAEAVGQ